MTGRPPLPIGAHGRIKTVQISARPVVWQSSCRVKDPDGVLRAVKRQGRSQSGAEANLQMALSERASAAVAGEVDGGTRVHVVAERWLANVAALVEAGDRADGTLANYESVWRVHLAPAVGQLRLRECTTARCEAWQVKMRAKHGPAICSTARAVLSGILGYAARMGAIAHNPVRGVSPIPGSGSRKRKPRALTATERTQWLEWMDTHVATNPKRERRTWTPEEEHVTAQQRALGDITRLMLGTGCRIGEALGVSWDEVDLEAGTVRIDWHIVRVRKKGLVRAEGAKSEAGERLLQVPSWCVDMLMRRRTDPRSGYPVFADAYGGWRDPNEVLRWIRWSREPAGLPWVTSHVFRQTVITVLDDAGLKPREIADHAGHSRIQQTQSYMQRRVASEAAAAALEDLL